jgi:hypothetical protein
MSKKKDLAVTGSLAEPIKVALKHPTIASGPDAMDAAAAANAEELIRGHAEAIAKLELVFPLFRVARTGNDAADYQALLLIVLRHLLPGFEVVDLGEPKPFRWSRTNPVALIMLVADVVAVRREKLPRECSESEACERLVISPRFAERWSRFNPRTLKNWLVDAKKKYLQIWRLAEVHQGALAFFEAPPVCSGRRGG